MADTLELEESELFDVNEHADIVLVKDSHHMAVLRSAIDDAGADSDDESETGLVDGFDDFDSSTASAGRSVLAAAAAEDGTAGIEMATSTGGFSEVGSLKRFDPVGGGVRFGSEGDLSLAASAPNNTFGVAMPPPRSITPGPPEYNTSAGYLGTSMPIRIPMMQQREFSGTTPTSMEGKAVTFVPPHLLEVQTDIKSVHASSLATSPSAAIKREKLIARNAILRSTGFIEVQRFAPVGEVIDAVKESILPHAEGGLTIPKRLKQTSSLTAMLSPSPNV